MRHLPILLVLAWPVVAWTGNRTVVEPYLLLLGVVFTARLAKMAYSLSRLCWAKPTILLRLVIAVPIFIVAFSLVAFGLDLFYLSSLPQTRMESVIAGFFGVILGCFARSVLLGSNPSGDSGGGGASPKSPGPSPSLIPFGSLPTRDIGAAVRHGLPMRSEQNFLRT